MLDRARQFTSHDFHDEKMRSLGRLAAGLAHELNNPASAVVRGAKALIVSLDEAEAADRALATSCPSHGRRSTPSIGCARRTGPMPR